MAEKLSHYLRLFGIAIILTAAVALLTLTVGLLNKWTDNEQYATVFDIASYLSFFSAWGVFVGSHRRVQNEIPYRELTDYPPKDQHAKEMIATGTIIFAEKPKQSIVKQSLKQVIDDVNQGYSAALVLVITGALLLAISNLISKSN